jgi:hypothetical protein
MSQKNENAMPADASIPITSEVQQGYRGILHNRDDLVPAREGKAESSRRYISRRTDFVSAVQQEKYFGVRMTSTLCG